MCSLCVLNELLELASRLLCMSSSEIRISSFVDVILIPLELIQSNRDAVRKAREALNTQKEHIPFSFPLPAPPSKISSPLAALRKA